MKNYTQFNLYKKNLEHNIKQIKKFTISKICAMVKADGYGYGMVAVSKIIESEIDFFGVANVMEGIELRKNGLKKPILVCGIIPENLIIYALKNDISIACGSLTYLKKIKKNLKNGKYKVNIHIKVNSGMNRLGSKDIDELKKMVELANEDKNIKIEGIFTHTGFSECQDKENLEKQHDNFISIVNQLDISSDVLIHFSNSGAFSCDKKYHHDMVRIGKLLYGVNANFSPNLFNLKPVFCLKTSIIQIQNVKKDEYIGYGENLKAQKDMQVGIIPIGYGDGFISQYTGCYVLIKGEKYKIISICMDLSILEIDQEIKVGDEVLVMGINGKNFMIPVTEYSSQSHKVASQVVANLNKNRFNIVVK
ncbi:MAG: alanine racemase [Clostridia bacterium]|nr:alanine racemase [Clostridia bacterium]